MRAIDPLQVINYCLDKFFENQDTLDWPGPPLNIRQILKIFEDPEFF